MLKNQCRRFRGRTAGGARNSDGMGLSREMSRRHWLCRTRLARGSGPTPAAAQRNPGRNFNREQQTSSHSRRSPYLQSSRRFDRRGLTGRRDPCSRFPGMPGRLGPKPPRQGASAGTTQTRSGRQMHFHADGESACRIFSGSRHPPAVSCGGTKGTSALDPEICGAKPADVISFRVFPHPRQASRGARDVEHPRSPTPSWRAAG